MNERYLEALEVDLHDEWERAHELVENLSSKEAAWIHAYLHRKEGDHWNANYWYARAGRTPNEGPLEQEWQELHDHFASVK